jgi:hypothetical protein
MSIVDKIVISPLRDLQAAITVYGNAAFGWRALNF